MSDRKIACLVELDYCVGCYACQSACQNYNDLPVKETYLRTVLLKPEKTEGTMHCFMSPVPYELERCATCMEESGQEAPCAKICIGAALHFGDVTEIVEKAKRAESKVALFM